MGDVEYVSIDIIKETLYEILHIKYKKLKKYIENISIKITNDDIKNYLTEKRNIDESRSEIINRYNPVLIKQNCSLNPFAFHYYKKCINILKEKINKLLYIIDNIDNMFYEKLSYNKELEFNNYLLQFDIILDKENKLIKRKDAIRIITPILENIDMLKEIEEKANNLDSYIGFRLSDKSSIKYGLNENGIYPDIKLQNKNISYFISVNSEYGYIPLSDNQKKLYK